jgi:hypothetical protein
VDEVLVEGYTHRIEGEANAKYQALELRRRLIYYFSIAKS